MKSQNFQKKMNTSGNYEYVEQKDGSTPGIIWEDKGKNKHRAMIVHLDFCNSEEIYKVKVVQSIKPFGTDKWNDIDGFDLINDNKNYRNEKTGKLVSLDKAITITEKKDKKTKKVLSSTSSINKGIVTGGKYFTQNLYTKSKSLFDLILPELAEKLNLK